MLYILLLILLIIIAILLSINIIIYKYQFINKYGGMEKDSSSSPLVSSSSPLVSSSSSLVSSTLPLGPTIEINNISFTLIAKIIDRSAPYFEIIQIQSVYESDNIPIYKNRKKTIKITNNEHIFYVYRSHSQCGLWRYIFTVQKYGQQKFYKGYDYAQSTLIYLDLQFFINSNIDALPEVYLHTIGGYLDENGRPLNISHPYMIFIDEEIDPLDVTINHPIQLYKPMKDGISRLLRSWDIFSLIASLLACGNTNSNTIKHPFLGELKSPINEHEILHLMSLHLSEYYHLGTVSEPLNTYSYILLDILKITGHIHIIKLSRDIDHISEDMQGVKKILLLPLFEECGEAVELFAQIQDIVKPIIENERITTFAMRKIIMQYTDEQIAQFNEYIDKLKSILVSLIMKLFINGIIIPDIEIWKSGAISNSLSLSELFEKYKQNRENIISFIEKINEIIQIINEKIQKNLIISEDDIELEKNVKNNNVYLYFLNATFEYIGADPISSELEKLCKQKHIMPILLTPAPSTDTEPDINSCTFMGLNSKYISSGLFICKMFEYGHQCLINEVDCISIGGEYKYIGDRYRDIYPFSKLISIYI